MILDPGRQHIAQTVDTAIEDLLESSHRVVHSGSPPRLTTDQLSVPVGVQLTVGTVHDSANK